MKKNAILDEQALMDTVKGAGRPLRLDDILRIMQLSRRLKKDVLIALHDFARNGALVHLPGGSWAVPTAMKMRRGRLAVQRSGAAFVTPEGEEQRAGCDISIAPDALGDAWNGDLVEVMLLPRRYGGRRPEGRVVSVIERGQREVAVRVLKDGPKGSVLCRPVDARLSFDILAEVSALEGRPDACALLLVRVGEKLEDSRRPLWAGTALAVLGQENDAAAQERLTKLNHAIPEEFPGNVLAEAEKAVSRPLQTEDLEDLRGAALVTIDGEDARDFDDAVCVFREGRRWRLLVAIADVAYYVRPRTALDREARERGNSCYFPMSVEPMLPEALCNGVCSLRPGEERRSLAVDMELDEDGAILNSRFVNALICSRARLTYRQVQALLDAPAGKAAVHLEKDAPGVPDMLQSAAELARTLIARRRRQGGLDFDLPEAEFQVEELGGVPQVMGIRNRERLFSHRLIEAFMVRANECVAEFLSRKQAPFLYRVHPAPGPEKLEELYRTLRLSDAEVTLPETSVVRQPAWLTGVLDEAAGSDRAFAVNHLVLRSMMQARYSPKEEGHFGLASARYCHFTSPIRRYADLVNHRALRYVLGLDTGGSIPAGHSLLEIAGQCNARERAAADAEREINRRMGCLLLQNRTGERFEGVISGVMSFGFFVELDGMPVEGMVRVETLSRDFYVYDEDRQELRGLRTGEGFRLGQRVTVKLAGVSVGHLEIDLEYQHDDEEGRRPFRKNKGRRGSEHGSRAFRPRRNERPWDAENGESPHRFRGDKAGRKNRSAGVWKKEEPRSAGKWADDESRGPRRPFRRNEDWQDRRDAPYSFRPRRDEREEDERREHGFRPKRRAFSEQGRDWEDRAGAAGSFRPHRNERWDAENGDSPRRFRRGDEAGRTSRPAGMWKEEGPRSPRSREEAYESRGPRRPFRRNEDWQDRRDAPYSFRPRRDEREEDERREHGFRPRRPFQNGFEGGFEDRTKDGRSAFREKKNFRRPHSPRFAKDEESCFPERRGQKSPQPAKKAFHGAPDDFFAIDTEERKPVHRFGKRRS
ncbi:VacB/RNase II family 3'-5' exoribonuclease [uncultured Mailhella sp.]|uniref:ribonuclease R family protein n=1 Tax=uncultured Mailhella sp. TaxID=1981031 RepID=UPI002608C4CB|nr:VacB/RNase II family 3'-5' exoribonuclease [uncultured Mailhella sp.]